MNNPTARRISAELMRRMSNGMSYQQTQCSLVYSGVSMDA